WAASPRWRRPPAGSCPWCRTRPGTPPVRSSRRRLPRSEASGDGRSGSASVLSTARGRSMVPGPSSCLLLPVRERLGRGHDERVLGPPYQPHAVSLPRWVLVAEVLLERGHRPAVRQIDRVLVTHADEGGHPERARDRVPAALGLAALLLHPNLLGPHAGLDHAIGPVDTLHGDPDRVAALEQQRRHASSPV